MNDAERITQLEQRIVALEALLVPADINPESAGLKIADGGDLSAAEKLTLLWQCCGAQSDIHKASFEIERDRAIQKYGRVGLPLWLMTPDEKKHHFEKEEQAKHQAQRERETIEYNRHLADTATGPIRYLEPHPLVSPIRAR